MAEPKAYEPKKLTAGVTWEWTKTLSGYPASERTLSYYLRKDEIGISSVPTTADGDTHSVSLLAAVSAEFTAGVYDLICIATKGAEKHVVFDGIVEVLPDPTASAAYDPRTHARRVLDLIEAAMEGHIPNGMESYTIGGLSINKIPLSQLHELYEKYAQDVRQEVQAERLANGRRSGKNIGVRRFLSGLEFNVLGHASVALQM